MATYYISPYGSDSNNGLGPDPGHATNKPWLTFSKVFGAAGIASGDTVFICPGVYSQQFTLTMTNPVAATYIKGDPLNVQGFKDGSGNIVPAGQVALTAYNTGLTAFPTGTSPIFSFSGRDYYKFSDISFYAARSSCISIGDGQNIDFIRCNFRGAASSSSSLVTHTSTLNQSSNITFQDCCFFSNRASVDCVNITTTRSATSETNLNIRFAGCLFLCSGGQCVTVAYSASANTYWPYGVNFYGCTFVNSTGVRAYTASATAMTNPALTVRSCIFACATGMSAGAVSHADENYNLFHCSTARSNVNAGANSISGGSHPLLMNWPNAVHMTIRPWLSPCAGSPFLGLAEGKHGEDTDLVNRPRLSGGIVPAVGCSELHDVCSLATSPVDSGTYSLKLTETSNVEFQIPVNNASTTITIKAQFNSTHGGPPRPRAIILANPLIGVSEQSLSCLETVADTWETLTFSAFTPTAKGVVVLRLESLSTTAGGAAFFDTPVVTES